MFIRKFYEAAAQEAGTATEVVEKSAAELMATMGKKSDENSATQPISIPEKKVDEKPAEEAKPAATAEEAKTTEKQTSETPQKTKSTVEEPKKVETPIAEAPQKVTTLEEVLKTNQPDTVLKALGFDDEKTAFVSQLKEVNPKMIGILQAYENGTLQDYVKELSVDYSKMEPEDLMRHQLKVDYPKANQKQLDILYKREVVDAYKLDSDDPDEVEEGKLLLGAKADRYRDSFIANQQKYLMPAKPEPKAVVPDNSAQQAKENVESYVRDISNDPYTKNIIANNKITLGEGEGAFSFPVDPQALIKNLSDAETWVNNMFDKQKGADGREYSVPKIQHQMLVATVAQYGTKFLDAYATHLKGLGAKEVIEPIDNASTPNKATAAKADPLPTSAAEAMAKQGVRRNG